MVKNTTLTKQDFIEILDKALEEKLERKFNEKLAPFATTKDVEAMLDEKLKDYVTKDELDKKFNEKLAPYPTKDEVQQMLNVSTEQILKELRKFDEERAVFKSLHKRVIDLETIHPNNAHQYKFISSPS